MTYILYRKCTVEPPITVQKVYSGATVPYRICTVSLKVLEASRIFQSLTNILYRKCTVAPPITVHKMYSGAYGGHFGYWRRFGVAEDEREPLAPIGSYIYSIAFCGGFTGRSVWWICRIFKKVLESSRSF